MQVTFTTGETSVRLDFTDEHVEHELSLMASMLAQVASNLSQLIEVVNAGRAEPAELQAMADQLADLKGSLEAARTAAPPVPPT